jgi:hypothetical protein
VQDIGKRLEDFSKKYPLVKFLPGWEPINEDRVVNNWGHREHSFPGPLSYASLLSGHRRLTDIIFTDDYTVAAAMTRCRSRYHGSRPSVVVQAGGVSVLHLRLAFAEAHSLICGEPNKIKSLRPIFSTK